MISSLIFGKSKGEQEMPAALTQSPENIKNKPSFGINCMQLYRTKPEREKPSAYLILQDKHKYDDLLEAQRLHIIGK